MPKSRKEKHHKHSSSEPIEYKLLTYAALGKHSKVAKLFAKHPEVDINFYDAHGNTALHQVCVRAAHLTGPALRLVLGSLSSLVLLVAGKSCWS